MLNILFDLISTAYIIKILDLLQMGIVSRKNTANTKNNYRGMYVCDILATGTNLSLHGYYNLSCRLPCSLDFGF